MRIFVKVKPKAKKNEIKQINEVNFIVSVVEPPEKGKANQAVLNLVAGYFGVSQSMVSIVFGAASRNKIIEVFKN